MILLSVACLAGYYLGNFAVSGLTQRDARTKLETVNGLYIDPSSLDMGEVWETPSHPMPLQVQNLSNEVRSIIDFEGSCGCLSVEPQRLSILPGETAKLSLTLDLTHRLPYQVGLAQWPVLVKLHPVFEGDFAATPGWELKARVRSRVSLETTQIAFTDQCSHAGPCVERKVRATAHVPLERLEASAVPDIAAVRVESVPDSPDNYVMVVSPRPELPIGPFSFQVQVRAITPDGELHRCASIEATGEMQPSCRVLPSIILLGEHSIPDQAEADISVRLPATDWKIDHIETDSSDTTVAQTGVEPDGSRSLRLSQKISRPDDQVSHVRIIVPKPDKQTEVLTVEVRYYGQISATGNLPEPASQVVEKGKSPAVGHQH